MLTGKTRFRQNWRGKLILQVEYQMSRTYDLNGSGYYDESTWTVWRDAKVSDLFNSKIYEVIAKSGLGEVK